MNWVSECQDAQFVTNCESELPNTAGRLMSVLLLTAVICLLHMMLSASLDRNKLLLPRLNNVSHTETTHIWLTCSPSKRYVVFMGQKVPENQMSWCEVYLKKNSLRRILSLHSHMTRIRWWCVALTRGQQVQIFTGFYSETALMYKNTLFIQYQ